MKHYNYLIAICLFMFMWPVHTEAKYSVDLPNNKITPSKGENATSMFVKNEGNSFYAIEIIVKRRKTNRQGEEILIDTDKLVVVPSQLIVKPLSEQIVNLEWIGAPLEYEKGYRILVDQLPIDLNAGQKNRKMLTTVLNYKRAFYVLPDKRTTRLSLTSAKPKVLKKQKSISVTVSNTGTAKERLNRVILSIPIPGTSEREDITFELKDSLDEVVSSSPFIYLFPKDILKINFPWPEKLEYKKHSFKLKSWK